MDMKIIPTYFQNNNIRDFKVLCLFERNHPKHVVRCEEAVPIMLQSFGKFSVVHEGEAYCHGSVAEVFPVWVKLATKPHGLDIGDLKKRLFEESAGSSQGSIYELSVHS